MRSHRGWGGLLYLCGQIPVAVEDFSQDWIVRFLGHWAFPPCVESRQVPFHHLNHAVPGLLLLSDTSGRQMKDTALNLNLIKTKTWTEQRGCWDVTYLTNKSGCAKKSAYISNKDLLSRMKVGRTTCGIQGRWTTVVVVEQKEFTQMMLESKRRIDCTGRKAQRAKRHSSVSSLLWSLYLCEVHAQTDLWQQMHDDALVLLHGLALSVIIPVVMAIKWIWGQQQRTCLTRLTQH